MEYAAQPQFNRGDTVHYYDRQDRLQNGVVLSIEATWVGFSKAGTAPIVVYTLWHPTYRDNRFHTVAKRIIGAA